MECVSCFVHFIHAKVMSKVCLKCLLVGQILSNRVRAAPAAAGIPSMEHEELFMTLL